MHYKIKLFVKDLGKMGIMLLLKFHYLTWLMKRIKFNLILKEVLIGKLVYNKYILSMREKINNLNNLNSKNNQNNLNNQNNQNNPNKRQKLII